MNEQTASPADRYLIRATLAGTGDGQSLQNVNTAFLPNGAACYVIADEALWVLDKTATPATVTNQSLAPGSGPGCWYRFGTAEALSPPAAVVAAGFQTFGVDGNWQAPSSTNAIFDSGANNPDPPKNWALTAVQSVLTYSGPTRQFLVMIAGAARVGDATAARDVFLGVSYNNDLTGAPSPGTSGEIDTTVSVASVDYAISTNRLVTLSATDTLRPKMAAPAAASTLSAVLRMAVVPV